MGDFRISDKPENSNPTGTALCLVENINVPGDYYKVPVADLNKGYLNGILIDDTNKADGYILAYNLAENKFEYVENTGGGGGGTWGTITGNLPDQTDLQTELDNKQNKATELLSFDSDIVFDGDNYIEENQTTDITYTLNATQPTEGEHYRTDVINNTGNSITLPVGIDVRGDDITQNKTNILNFRYLAYKTGSVAEKTTVVNEVRDLPSVPTAPLVSTSSVEDSDKNALVVVFNKNVNIVDLTGLSIPFTVGTPKTITAIESGDGTSTLTFTLSGDIDASDVFTFDYDGTNTITAVDGGLSLVASSTNVTNNVGSAGANYVASSAEIGNVTGNIMSLDFDVAVDFTDATGFAITASGGAVTATGTGGETNSTSGTVILSRPLAGDETVTFEMTGSNTIYLTGTSTPATPVLAGEAVVNNLIGTVIPQAIYTFANDDVSDSSGNGNDGTQTNLTFDVDSHTGTKSVKFPSPSSGTPKINGGIGTSGDFSVIMIMKMTDLGAFNQALLGWDSAAQFSNNSLWVSNNADEIRLSGQGSGDRIANTTDIVYNAYMMVGASYNATTGAAKIYANNNTPITGTLTTINPLGNFIIGNDISNTQAMEGYIDEVRFYDEVITDGEYTSIYNAKFP